MIQVSLEQKATEAKQQCKNIKVDSFATVYIRNFAKMGSKLTLPQKMDMDKFRNIASKRMSIEQKNLILFAQGKALQPKLTTIDLYNGLILYTIDIKRVNVPEICIYFRRIQQNAVSHKFIVSSQMKIHQFIIKQLSTKYNDIYNLFLVYAGRQLLKTKTFKQEFVQNQSEILLIHKIENLKKVNVVNNKNDKGKKEIHPITNNVGNNLNSNCLKETIKNQQTVKQLPQNQYHHQSIATSGKINDESKKNQTKMLNELKVKENLIKNSNNAENQSFPQNQFNPTPLLSETKKINNSSDKMKLWEPHNNNSQKVGESNDEYEQDQQIIINSYNAYSCLKSKEVVDNQKLSQLSNNGTDSINSSSKVSQKNHKVVTKYGIAPYSHRTQFNRQCQQDNKKWNEQIDSIQVLVEDQSNDISSEMNKAKNQQDDISEKQCKQKSDLLHINPMLLATISSRYEEEQLCAIDSSFKSSNKNSRALSHQTLNQGGSCINLSNSKQKKNVNEQQYLQVKAKQAENKILKNLPLSKSCLLESSMKGEQDFKQPSIQNELFSNQSEVQQYQLANKSEVKSQTNKQQQQPTDVKITMKKGQIRVKLQDMIQSTEQHTPHPISNDKNMEIKSQLVSVQTTEQNNLSIQTVKKKDINLQTIQQEQNKIQQNDNQQKQQLATSHGLSLLSKPIQSNISDNKLKHLPLNSEINKFRDPVLDNISYVSSVYNHGTTNSSLSSQSHPSNIYNLPPPQQIRDSFISNVKESHSSDNLWGPQSNSISCIQSMYVGEPHENSACPNQQLETVQLMKGGKQENLMQSNLNNVFEKDSDSKSAVISKRNQFSSQPQQSQLPQVNFYSIKKKKNPDKITSSNNFINTQITKSSQDSTFTEIYQLQHIHGVSQQKMEDYGFEPPHSITNLLAPKNIKKSNGQKTFKTEIDEKANDQENKTTEHEQQLGKNQQLQKQNNDCGKEDINKKYGENRLNSIQNCQKIDQMFQRKSQTNNAYNHNENTQKHKLHNDVAQNSEKTQTQLTCQLQYSNSILDAEVQNKNIIGSKTICLDCVDDIGTVQPVEKANANIGDMIMLNGTSSLYPNNSYLTSTIPTTYANQIRKWALLQFQKLYERRESLKKQSFQPLSIWQKQKNQLLQEHSPNIGGESVLM